MGNGKVAFVTGSSRGIGRGCAHALAKAGYDIVINHSHSLEAAEKTLAEVKAIGVRALILQGDMGEIGVHQRLVDETITQLGRLDVLVNNAGITRFEGILDITPETMDYLYNVDFRGMILMAQAAARYMVKNEVKGSIIFNTSIRSFSPHPTDCVYGALKAGLNRIIKSFAVDLGRYGIRVNGFSPGVTNVWAPDPEDEKKNPFYKNAYRFIPLRRPGYAADMGGPVVWLASDDSSYVTGQVICVDGGLSAVGMPEHYADLTDLYELKDWLVIDEDSKLDKFFVEIKDKMTSEKNSIKGAE
jgi:NAD(P)-dependent dehydrogenase (short-subunit alcohol dehydrogenase family)